MSDLSISAKEISFLKRRLIHEMESDNIDVTTLRWNSNIKNYQTISKVIEDGLKNIKDVEKSKLKIKDVNQKIDLDDYAMPSSFLRDFFYKEDEAKKVREKSINKLYRFLFQLKRKEYLEQESIDFTVKNQFVYSLSPLKDNKNLLELVEDRIKGRYEPRTLSTSDNVEKIILHAASGEDQLYIIITDELLLDIVGIELILKLFKENLIRLIVDFNVNFILDESVSNPDEPRNIKTIKGIIKYSKHWHEVREDLEKYQGEEFKSNRLSEILNISYLVPVLKNLGSFVNCREMRKSFTINSFLPALSEVINKMPEPMWAVYKRQNGVGRNYNELKLGEGYNFFCVIAYRHYFSHKDRKEMLFHFSNYSNHLRNANITRVFTIPGKQVKGKGWCSQLKPEENQLLFQYVMINAQLNVETYILMYDEQNVDQDVNILWNQDYVIRLKSTPDIIKEGQIGVKKTLNRISLSTDLPSNIEDSELYFAYPEMSNLQNQILSLSGKKQGLYINRMYEDFWNRIFLEPKTSGCKLLKIKKEIDFPLLIFHLQMNKLDDTIIDNLKNEVETYINQYS